MKTERDNDNHRTRLALSVRRMWTIPKTNRSFDDKLEFFVGRQLVASIRFPRGICVTITGEEFLPLFPLEPLLFFFGSLELGSCGGRALIEEALPLSPF